MCKSCSSTQIIWEMALFFGKIYTAGTNFTRPPVVTVATNLNSSTVDARAREAGSTRLVNLNKAIVYIFSSLHNSMEVSSIPGLGSKWSSTWQLRKEVGQSLASSGHRCLEGGMGIVPHSARSYGYLECQNEIVKVVETWALIMAASAVNAFQREC